MPTIECPACGKIVSRQWIGGTNRPIPHKIKGGALCTGADTRRPTVAHQTSNDPPIPFQLDADPNGASPAVRPARSIGRYTAAGRTDAPLSCPNVRLNSKRIIDPPLEEIKAGRLRTPLNSGEMCVLDFFDNRLPLEWEIYVQPHLNGLRPDFVLLNPNVGIAVFEVKDWNLDAMKYFVRNEDASPRLWCRDHGGKEFPCRDNPVEKVLRYKDEILSMYCPRLGIQVRDDPGVMATVTAGVILTSTTTERAAELFGPFLKHSKSPDNKAAPYHPVVGQDALAGGKLEIVFPGSQWSSSKFMTPELAEDFRPWLREPEHAAIQRKPLELNADQQRIATSRTRTGYRRVRGPAGCGKSLSLAARATQLAGEGKEVLVVSFNITLLHYLHDLAVRYPHPRGSIIRNITWLHFHDWCKRVCQEGGMEPEYMQLFRGLDPEAQGEAEAPDDLFDVRIPELVGRVLDEAGDLISSYNAIIVDEGQDFHLTWWNLLRRVRRDGGEMLLAADQTQDLYRRSCHWTDESMRGAGFDGPWLQLNGSYRFPPKLVPHLRQFAEQFLHGADINLAANAQGYLFDEQLPSLRWLQVKDADAVDACVRAVRDLASTEVTWSDITLLVATHEEGLRCVQALASLNIKVRHVFAGDQAASKKLKMAFWMGDARIKAATIHSFKGWEATAMVIHISRATTAGELAADYVALSRLRRSERGSSLTVVCSAPELESYGRTWPAFNMC
jgi:hypothetical protein